MEKIEISQVTYDKDIYPRKNESQTTIDSYAEAMTAGANFPPITLQKIKNNGDGELIVILDGLHRYKAYKKNKIDEIDCTYWKTEILDKKENLTSLRLHSAWLNITHGDRLKTEDKKRVARDTVESDPKVLNKELAEKLGVTEKCMSEWVSDIRAKQQASKNNFIYRLHLLGWKQQEIADVIGMKQPNIQRDFISNFTEVKNDIILGFSSGKPIPEIAKYHNLDIQLTWAIVLEGKSDLERFNLFGSKDYGNKQPRLDDCWRWPTEDLRLTPLIEEKYPGRLWGQNIMNILYKYTKQGDLVIDPMAGGGSTIDTCLIMNRKCKAYDINPIRKDISEWDIRNGFHDKIKNCDFILFDPPYYKKKEYSTPDLMQDRESFIGFVNKFASDSYKILRKNGYIVLIYSQYIDYEDETKSIGTADLGRLFEDAGYRWVMQIQAPLSFSVQYSAYDVERAKEEDPWKLLPVSRTFDIFKKLI